MPDLPELIPLTEFKRKYKGVLGESTIQKAVKSKALRTYRVGDKLLVSAPDFFAWLEARTYQGPDPSRVERGRAGGLARAASLREQGGAA